jgi:hypothetical protein
MPITANSQQQSVPDTPAEPVAVEATMIATNKKAEETTATAE